jgi:hypothetical protein
MVERTRPNITGRIVGAVVAFGLAVFAASRFPAVEGLGTKVRLPVFHGALTWANLAVFALMAIVAIIFIATRSDGVFRFEGGLRWVSVPMWIVGSALGLNAALNTWDLTGSQSSVFSVVTADPRLMAQFWVLLLALLLLLLPLFVESAVGIAIGDLVFNAAMWTIMLRAILGPGRALHPDSPVWNSPELEIKLVFVGIFLSLFASALFAAWALSTRVRTPAELAAHHARIAADSTSVPPAE